VPEAAADLATVVHELCHTFGLHHSVEKFDVMARSNQNNAWTFSQREKATMRLVMQRRAGNRYPDNGRGGLAAAQADGPVEFRCPR
jgi:hypothetical protein